jgi:hypothetical protein
MDTAEQVALTFCRERETANTVRFAELAEDGEAVVGKLYVRKAAFAQLGSPERLTVTLRP